MDVLVSFALVFALPAAVFLLVLWLAQWPVPRWLSALAGAALIGTAVWCLWQAANTPGWDAIGWFFTGMLTAHLGVAVLSALGVAAGLRQRAEPPGPWTATALAGAAFLTGWGAIYLMFQNFY